MSKAEQLALALQTGFLRTATTKEAAALLRAQDTLLRQALEVFEKVEMIQADLDNKSDIAQRALAERDALRAEMEAARKDAARYRWIRRPDNVSLDGWLLTASDEHLDGLIDAAMEATK